MKRAIKEPDRREQAKAIRVMDMPRPIAVLKTLGLDWSIDDWKQILQDMNASGELADEGLDSVSRRCRSHRGPGCFGFHWGYICNYNRSASKPRKDGRW
jgi:hypothetical protein